MQVQRGMRSCDMLGGTVHGLAEFEKYGFDPERNGILLLLNRGVIISYSTLNTSPCSVENGLKGG